MQSMNLEKERGLTQRKIFSNKYTLNMDEEIARICINSKKLVIIYDKMGNCLSSCFKTDKEMLDYINNNIDEAFKHSIEKKSDELFILNIASTENFGAFPNWKGMENLLNQQLSIFMPIIQKFIFYVNTGHLI